jgi:hypothetical protein
VSLAICQEEGSGTGRTRRAETLLSRDNNLEMGGALRRSRLTCLLDFDSKDGSFGFGLAVSPDGKWVWYSKAEPRNSDVVLMQNLRGNRKTRFPRPPFNCGPPYFSTAHNLP